MYVYKLKRTADMHNVPADVKEAAVKFVLVAAVVATMYGALAHANAVEDAHRHVSLCVIKKAHAEGYRGNVHGPEAWALFASSCK